MLSTSPATHASRMLVALLLATSAVAWFALWRWGASPYAHGVHLYHDAGGPDGGGFPAFVIGWTLMTVAMMLPTISPLVIVFARAVDVRTDRVLLIAGLVAGYLAVWVLAGVGAYAAAIGIRGAVFTFAPHRAVWIIGAGALLIAGLYQFSPLKDRCLEHCRSPFSFIMERWNSEGLRRQALSAGIRHGLFCVGCCWALMLLMLPLGASNLAWMLLLGVVMAAEKNAPGGRQMSKPIGAILLFLAVVVAIRGQ
jgi:predicted metal-binding membrane protein